MSDRMLDPRSDLHLALSDLQKARIGTRCFRCAFSELFGEEFGSSGVAVRAVFVGRTVSDGIASVRDESNSDITVSVGDTIAEVTLAPSVHRGPYVVTVVEPVGTGLVALRLQEST